MARGRAAGAEYGEGAGGPPTHGPAAVTLARQGPQHPPAHCHLGPSGTAQACLSGPSAVLTLQLRRTVEIKHRRRPDLLGRPESGGWPRGRQARFGLAWLQGKQRLSKCPSACARPGLERSGCRPPRKSPPDTLSPPWGLEERWQRRLKPSTCGTALPFGATSRTAVLPPRPQCPTRPVPGSQGSPAQASHPGHRSRVQGTRQAICANSSPGQEDNRVPRPVARDR